MSNQKRLLSYDGLGPEEFNRRYCKEWRKRNPGYHAAYNKTARERERREKAALASLKLTIHGCT